MKEKKFGQTAAIWMVGALLVLAAAPAAAEEESGGEAATDSPGIRAGLGVDTSLSFGGPKPLEMSGLGGLGGLSIGPGGAGIRVPIRFGESFRLEPRLAFSFDHDETYHRFTDKDGNPVVRKREGKNTGIGATLAGHYLWGLGDTTEAYLGLEAGVDHFRSSATGDLGQLSGQGAESKMRATTVRGGPVLGGAYRFSPNFQLGLEGAIEGYYVTHDDEPEESDPETPTNSSVGVGTRASVVLRLLF